MSTSLLYHAWGLIDCRFKFFRPENGAIHFGIEVGDRLIRCAQCRSHQVSPRGKKHRQLKTLPIGDKPVFIHVDVPRVHCGHCRTIRQIKLPFADERYRYTRAFERYVLTLSRFSTIQDVARHLRVGWDMIKDIQKRCLTRHYRMPKLNGLRRIAIDEIYVGKNQGYLTIVLNLDNGHVVFVGDGKDADALKPFWKRLKRNRIRIRVVATDMGPAYISAVMQHLPKATLVFDHFHVIKLFNEKLTTLRRDLQREIEDVEQKTFIKGTRWLLLKNPDKLNPERGEQERLEAALKHNKPLATAYYMKESLRQIWRQENRSEAADRLDDWIKTAQQSGINVLQQFAKTLAAHRSGILAYYDADRLSTGPLEGTNNKIKTLKRMAYGFRDMAFFKLKIKALHESKYALTG